MKRTLIILLVFFYVTGCVHLAPQIVSSTINEGKISVKLTGLAKANVALLPLRSVLGNPVGNNTVKEHFSQYITSNFPQVGFIQPGKLSLKIAANGSGAILQYNQTLNKYFTRGRLDRDSLAVFASANIDYVIALSLNSGTQNHFYPETYLFLISMQIWDTKTGQIVSDITKQGKVLIESEEDDQTNRILLMENLCNEILAKLS